jgi:NADH-quinone oxidoreductase subunit C
MDAPDIIAALNPLVPGVSYEAASTPDCATVYVPVVGLVRTCGALRDSLGFEVLVELTAVDYLPRTPRFEVVYHLLSIANRRRVRLKVRVEAGDGVPTVQGVWPSAGWPEREVWDMFGIPFDGHPDLRRILMPEEWEGHPLRKDYPVQIRKATDTYEPLQVTEEAFRANIERDRFTRTKPS